MRTDEVLEELIRETESSLKSGLEALDRTKHSFLSRRVDPLQIAHIYARHFNHISFGYEELYRKRDDLRSRDFDVAGIERLFLSMQTDAREAALARGASTEDSRRVDEIMERLRRPFDFEIRRFGRSAPEPRKDKESAASPIAAPTASGSHAASTWTGMHTLSEQTVVILELVPSALAALDHLIDHLEMLGHNGGPPDPERNLAIATLQQLHAALGELLRLAQAGQSFGRAMKSVEKALAVIRSQVGEGHRALVSSFPATSICSALTYSVYALTGAITGDPSAQVVVAGAAAGTCGAILAKRASSGE